MSAHPKPSGDAERPSEQGEPPVHVFDQTNGVLGQDDEDGADDDRRGRTSTPPSSFGVPPITSL